MKTTLAAVLIVLLAGPAFAWDVEPATITPPPPTVTPPPAKAKAKANATASAKSASRAVAVQGGASVGPVSVENRTGSTIAPPALGGLASGPCSGVSGGVSVGVAGFGGGLQSGTLDGQCTLRENIRIVAQFDYRLAREMTDDLDGVKEARHRLNRRLLGVDDAPPYQAPARRYPVPELPLPRDGAN